MGTVACRSSATPKPSGVRDLAVLDDADGHAGYLDVHPSLARPALRSRRPAWGRGRSRAQREQLPLAALQVEPAGTHSGLVRLTSTIPLTPATCISWYSLLSVILDRETVRTESAASHPLPEHNCPRSECSSAALHKRHRSVTQRDPPRNSPAAGLQTMLHDSGSCRRFQATWRSVSFRRRPESSIASLDRVCRVSIPANNMRE